MINKIEAKKAHCGGAQSSASVSGALGAAAQCAPMAPPLSNRGGAENSRAESNEQESFEHYSTFITDSKGRLIVSTHSRPKAAGGAGRRFRFRSIVSTHSRPKAAGL